MRSIGIPPMDFDRASAMEQSPRLSLQEIERRVCDITSEQLGLRRQEVHPHLRLIKDLNCDSLDAVEFLMEIEDEFDVGLPHDSPSNMAYKVVFTREEFRLSDLAELVYLQQGSGRATERRFFSRADPVPVRQVIPFTQLGGRIPLDHYSEGSLFEMLGKNAQGHRVFRRRTDGMMCVKIPSAEAVIGNDNPASLADERPARRVHIESFIIDQEPVSTTAYCRFLNSIGPVDRAMLEEWFVLGPNDKRQEHELLRQAPDGWQPWPGTERMPMVLVSWFGAEVYSRWANRKDWQSERDPGSFLPTESQWEYAARGVEPRSYPWGDDEPTPEKARYARHTRGQTYRPEQLPMADVNVELGMSPFGLHHMAGNVWQWCRDWYAPQVRSERGGSWVGPAFLCRSSHRRGRIPCAKGRCLGFRCISEASSD